MGSTRPLHGPKGSTETNRQSYRVKEECIPKKPFLITKSNGRQIGLCEEIEFSAPEGNKAGPERLEETLKALKLHTGNARNEL